MFRTKSFNIHRPVETVPLTRAKSAPNIALAVANARVSMTVREIDAKEACSATNRMMNNTMDSGWKYENPSHFLDDKQQKWNSRYDEALSVFDLVSWNAQRELSESKKKLFFFAAYYQGVPVGILQLTTENGFAEVDYLATHCGIRNCGVLLIEQAVNKSQQLGMQGKIKLRPLQDAIPAYIKMGFIKVPPYLELDPAQTEDKWHYDKVSNRYKYQSC
ncbi:N-acetyltransferase [Xenorhabdus beddingii]|uniref:N-acetyltransferase n=2 Tax=Xenorhabdus beddingii TaxID=40578 RepID=A0A1Y2SQU8_9GAMM|nr:N-acetyltransferase [Xenorhabdus beddingii]